MTIEVAVGYSGTSTEQTYDNILRAKHTVLVGWNEHILLTQLYTYARIVQNVIEAWMKYHQIAIHQLEERRYWNGVNANQAAMIIALSIEEIDII